MAKNGYIGIGNVARKIKTGYIGVNGIARKIKSIYIGDNGLAKLIYTVVKCLHPEDSYSETIITNPTCTTEGSKSCSCTACDKTWTEPIKALGHTWVEQEDSRFSSGYGKVCSVCKELGEELDKPDHIHNWTKGTTVAPTCTAQGYTNYSCACGETKKDDYVDAKGHKYVNGVCAVCGEKEETCTHPKTTETIITEATCFSTGVKNTTCDACGKVIETEEISMTAHYLLDDWVEFTAATCTKTGIKRRYCHNDNCSHYEEKTIPKTEHSWSENAVEWEGGLAYECTICGAHNPIPDETCDHASAEAIKVVKPTCTSGGYTTYKCSLCGHEWDGDDTAALGHTWVEQEDSRFSSGYGKVCSVCKELGEELSKPEHEHNWVATENDGFSSGYGYVCTECGALGDELEMPECSHPEEFVVEENSKSATCETDGSVTYRCTRCNKEWTDTIDALGHNWVAQEHDGFSSGYGYVCSHCEKLGDELEMPTHEHNWTKGTVVAPTCTAQGYTNYSCACGETKKDDYVDATGHYLLDDWVEFTEATCTETGVERRYCHNDNCGHYEERTISETGHNWSDAIIEWGNGYARECKTCGYTEPIDSETCDHTDEVIETVQATCTSGGHTTYKCSLCGREETREYTDALGHNYVSVVTAPTCTAKGYTTHTCSKCNDSYVDSYTDTIDHVKGEPVLSNADEMNCQVCAHYKVYCKNCDTLLDEYNDDGNFGEHDDSNPSVVQPTCTEQGYIHYVCGVCLRETKTFTDPALGHDWVLEKNSGFSSGYGYVCSRCGTLGDEAAHDCSVFGHETDDGSYDIDGEEMYKCKHCGEYYPTN